MNLKPTVEVAGTKPELWYALGVVDCLHKEATSQPIEITSMVDGPHMPGSLHAKGQAADIRTRDIDDVHKKALYARCLATLFPLGFDVILEADHMHIEYDPKPGRGLLHPAP